MKMITQLGFADSLTLPGVEELHHCPVLFTRESSERSRFGRSKLLVLDERPKVWRGGGVAVAYGLATPALWNLLRKEKVSTLIVISDGETKNERSKGVIARLEKLGKQVVEVDITSSVGQLRVVGEGVIEITKTDWPA